MMNDGDNEEEPLAPTAGGGTTTAVVTKGMNNGQAPPPDGDVVDALPSDLRYSCIDILYTLVSILTYLFDLVMDCAVAFYFYHLGVSHGVYHYWYCGLTITFVLLPSLTMTGFSLRWYLMDADNADLPPVPLWRWILRVIVLMIQFAPILRYLDSIRYGWLSRQAAKEEDRLNKANDSLGAARAHEKRERYYTLMVYEDADATLLRLFECFMESAPQLVLQIYILIKDPSSMSINEGQLAEDKVADQWLKTTILCVSVISSLVSLAWSLVVYHRSLRYTYPDKKNMDWRGSTFQFLWHFSSITARVIALSLFASAYPEGIFAICAAHWAVMSTWVIFQGTQACNNRCEEVLFSAVLGAIYIFSFFNAKEERTRFKYIIYYSFCFCENTALVVVWILNAPKDTLQAWYFYPGVVGHYLAFFLGLTFMVVYYGCFHPSEIQKFSFKVTRGRFAHRRTHHTDNLFFKGLRRISNFKLSPTNGEGGGGDEAIEMQRQPSAVRPSELAVDGDGCGGENRPLSRNLSSPANLDAQESPDEEEGPRPTRRPLDKKASSLPPAAAVKPVPHHLATLTPRSIKAMGSERTLKPVPLEPPEDIA